MASAAPRELRRSGELAALGPAATGVAEVQEALDLLVALPKLMFPQEQVNAIAQQLIRVLLSYQQWYLPQVLRHDLPGGPQRWSVGVPAAAATGEGSGQLLPLCSDEAAFSRLAGSGVRGGDAADRPDVVRTVLTGAAAVVEHLPEQGGIVFDAGGPRQFALGQDRAPQLRNWQATLRLEHLLTNELRDKPEDAATPERPAASEELAELLSGKVRLSFVRMGSDLARDNSGQNIVTLTSSDAAARCALAYGREMVRPVSVEELRSMAQDAGGAFGYSLTVGCSRSAEGVPMWNSRAVSAAWLVAALQPIQLLRPPPDVE